MLPFLKESKEGAAAAQPVQKLRVSDRDDDYSLLDAVADDMLEAFKSGDRGRLKQALEAFKEHLQDEDQEQDADQLSLQGE